VGTDGTRIRSPVLELRGVGNTFTDRHEVLVKGAFRITGRPDLD